MTIELRLEERLPMEVDLDGILDPNTCIEYIGKALLQPNGKYVCLAKVPNGASTDLCRVEVSIKEREAVQLGFDWKHLLHQKGS